MSKRRIAVAGAGSMARSRGRAFLDTGRAEICGVASRHLETARRCAAELGCEFCCDDFRRLAETRPDALLIEVPHRPQDEIALWALDAGLDLLIGGNLTSCMENGSQIPDLASRQGRIVEVGYQRRYDPAWEEIRRLIIGGILGEPVMAVSMALFDADPRSWYYDQETSGGMPLTHLSYCYLNAIRWILGKPSTVAAMANRKVETAPGRVLEETCGVLVGFENGAFASATASYIDSQGMTDAGTRFLCTEGSVQPNAEDTPGTVSITVFQGGRSEVRVFSNEPAPFVHQAGAFLDAIETRDEARNPPEDALMDIRVAEAISISAREHRTITLKNQEQWP